MKLTIGDLYKVKKEKNLIAIVPKETPLAKKARSGFSFFK
jgi:hypothetical protein